MSLPKLQQKQNLTIICCLQNLAKRNNFKWNKLKNLLNTHSSGLIKLTLFGNENFGYNFTFILVVKKPYATNHDTCSDFKECMPK